MTLAELPTTILLADTAEAAGVFFGLGVAWMLLALAAAVFWVWALIDSLTNRSLEPSARLMWALIIFLLPFLGAVAYLIVGRNSGPGRMAHR